MEYSIDLDESSADNIKNLALSFASSLLCRGGTLEPSKLSDLAMDYAINWYKDADKRTKMLSLAFPVWTDLRQAENHDQIDTNDKHNLYWYVSDCDTPNNHGKYIVKRGKFISRTEDNFYFGDFENGSYKEIPNKAVFVLLDETLNQGKDFPALPLELECQNNVFPPKKQKEPEVKPVPSRVTHW